ncbi:MAG TPA: uroporphyrinogen decarboxylase family protein [Methylomirabilota bacterium]|nr:uroporphyrinogen decarboxylase family protein [Methylomirabilota bacterium]
MTRRERVLAALRGEPVDRVPIAFWLHNFATENSAAGLAAETLRLARVFDWDFLKPQSRAQCFAEMWGLTYRPSTDRATQYTVTHTPLAGAADVARLEPVDPRAGALGEQLAALAEIRAAIGPDTPIIWTIFSPLMVLPFLLRGGREQALEIARADPKALDAGLAAIAETLTEYARACVAGGADGLFYATNVARRGDGITAEACRRFQRPHDLHVLAAVAGAPFNLLHVCGPGVHFDEFADYPVTAFSWALGGGNPSLAEVHRRTGRAVVGGLPAKPEIASLSAEAIAARARQAVAQMNGRALLLGPDCSINPDTPETLLHAAAKVVRG